MDLQTINQRYGRYIWKIANRYHTGIWASEDVFNQILLQIHSAVNTGQLSESKSKEAAMRVKSFIITHAIDILRYEKRRRCASTHPVEGGGEDVDASAPKHRDEALSTIEPVAPPSSTTTQFEIDLIKELLFTRLDPQTAKFMFELAFPTFTTVEIAEADRTAARADVGLRMNVRELKVLPRHVAEYMKRGGQHPPSPATISRMRTKAREAIYEKEKEKG